MISFTCFQCGRSITVDDEEAGRDIQCTVCGVLCSVPLPSDLEHLNPDGTLRLVESTPAAEPDRLDRLARAFGRAKIDPRTGLEVDNRTLAEEIELAPIVSEKVTARPIYDPETGELLRPIDVARAAPVPAIPIDQKPGAVVLGYRTRGAATRESTRVEPWQVWLQLLMPMNVIVMSVVLVGHVLFVGALFVASYIFFAFFMPLFILLVLFSHYGNIVDEIGPSAMDELPRPLRDVSFNDDFWAPLRDFFFSLFFLYLPLVAKVLTLHFAKLQSTPLLDAATWIAMGVTAAFTPALFLTLRTSGSLRNIRPDRLVRMVWAVKFRYAAIAALTIAAACVYGYGLVGVSQPVLGGGSNQSFFGRSAFRWATLAVGIYGLHAAMWQLGLLYRKCQPVFGWVDQEHVRKTPSKTIKGRLTPVEKSAMIQARSQPAHMRRQALSEGIRGS